MDISVPNSLFVISSEISSRTAHSGDQSLSKKELANKVNHIHFLSGYLIAHVQFKTDGRHSYLNVSPEPCYGDMLTCRWIEESTNIEDIEILELLLFEGKAVIRISCNTKEISNESFSFALPGSSCVIGQRRARRYACHGIVAEFIQGKPRTMGILWDFSPLGFRVSLSAGSSRICRSFDEDLPVFVVLRRDQTVLFSGVCRYIRGHIGIGQGEVVVTSSESNTKGSSKIEVRSPRIRMKPCPYMDFDHPIVGKGMRFEIFDISTSGLSVYESGDESVLMPGMRIS